ncbi:DUF2550 family protein [Cellulomonas wangsupingiae]|uniref:DUF2550 domain-containing protein n=1 Tax=Cellulomonas wangsupingiae TaxID=2968085 RepID=A0ABY5K6V4_9CELL|nr:DUF2550 family protein [Cellulomonas wangsupingiae]MCC2334520.1 DUF2550 domain-containing protein [Cellulomonas wangsupingiae]MCM0640109.1 DUF2550 domain-containing protein [Cellulomonas wangsupingiae]UUI66177.1 DUF2550 domain-containing protein [Cellulomonas wangsupingiae]
MSGAAWCALVVASSVLLVAVVGGVWLSRTRALTRRVGSFQCRLVEVPAGEGAPGARGVAQYGAASLYWWRRASVVPRPARTWSRGSIVVVERTVLPLVPGRPQAVVAHCRVVPAAGGAEREIRLQMSADAYAGFTSWLEATPWRAGRIV